MVAFSQLMIQNVPQSLPNHEDKMLSYIKTHDHGENEDSIFRKSFVF